MIFFSCNFKNNDRVIDTKLTLAGEDKSAFGAYVFQFLYKNTFEHIPYSTNKRPFDKWYKDQQNATDYNSASKQVYCIVTPRLKTWDNEVQDIADFIAQGNTLFIASDFFEQNLLNLFKVKQETLSNGFSFDSKPKMRDTYKLTIDTAEVESATYGYYFYPFFNKIIPDSSIVSQVIGQSDFKVPDILRIKHGKGELILMTNAAALSNYFLLSAQNYRYAQTLLSYLPFEIDAVFWDDFYRRVPYRQLPNESMLSVLLAIPHLRWAFIILAITAFLWVLTSLFRQQRIIPFVIPHKNSSLEFTQTIARLYFNKKDNKNIAVKMIAFFNDWLRNKYYMAHQNYNEAFINNFSSKSNISKEKIEQLADIIYTVQHNTTIDDATLLDLNKQLQQVFSNA